MATLVAAIPVFVAQQHGHLVGISSLAGNRGLPTSAAYSASKAALSVFLESLVSISAPHRNPGDRRPARLRRYPSTRAAERPTPRVAGRQGRDPHRSPARARARRRRFPVAAGSRHAGFGALPAGVGLRPPRAPPVTRFRRRRRSQELLTRRPRRAKILVETLPLAPRSAPRPMARHLLPDAAPCARVERHERMVRPTARPARSHRIAARSRRAARTDRGCGSAPSRAAPRRARSGCRPRARERREGERRTRTDRRSRRRWPTERALARRPGPGQMRARARAPGAESRPDPA